MKAIDVSYYQGKIDYNKVKSAGIGAVIVRAGSDRKVDPTCVPNLQGFMAVNIPVGVYWLGIPLSVAQAKEEAQMCIGVIKKYKLNLPVYYDWEEYSEDYYKKATGKAPTKKLVTDMHLAFCAEIEKAGFRAGYYTNYDIPARLLDESKLKAKGYSKWLACWGPNQPSNAGDIWQSGIGRVNGINGDVDLDTLINEKLIQGMSNNGGGSNNNGGNTAPVESSITVSMPTLTVGCQGKAVKIWQIIVGETPDGIFGSKTLTKTKNFQKATGLTQDGIVGPASWTKGLNSV
ncbi:MAG: peptidoglycan-binding protein [Ruminococcus sp.]|nr:peptidoglycan-binding protein [Ruminococcus sp.]